MINLYLVRHAKAEPASGKKSDAERELSNEGITILKDSISIWKYYIDKINFIISSPLKRAVQTAEIIRKEINFSEEIIKDTSLLPGSESYDVIQLLKTYKSENIILIGHQPDISTSITEFLGCPGLEIPFKPAAFAKISFEGKPAVGRGILEILIPPVLK